jgi:uncharacterized membrane protein YozB (DUF420 family)
VHAFYSGWKGKKFHAASGVVAIVWDLSLSIGYMTYRSLGGEVGGASLQLNPTFTAYFAVHGVVAVLVMALEIAVLGVGIRQLQLKKKFGLHSKLTKVLFSIWWIAFFSGEIFYLVMYAL